MHAVVLVGGFGTRLRPLTFTTPKPLLPVGHVPLVERAIETLVAGGVTEVTLALGFKPEPFMECFPDAKCAGATLHYAVEPEPLDTAGAIAFAARHTGITETFVVANGDVLTDLNVAELIAFHRSKGAEATIHLIPVEDPSQYGVVETDPDGRVTRFVEKPKPGESSSRMINAGTYVFEPSVIELIPVGARMSVEREVFPAVAQRGQMFAMASDVYWIDAGRADTYLTANIDTVNGNRNFKVDGVSPDARVAPDALIQNSIVGAGATVEFGAKISNSVILPGAYVATQSVVTNCTVMGRIDPCCKVSESIVGADGVIQAGSQVVGALIPDPSKVD
jgi:mannose-1-phosphate guanylyltransferase